MKNVNCKSTLEICFNKVCFVSYPQLFPSKSYNFFKSGSNCKSLCTLTSETKNKVIDEASVSNVKTSREQNHYSQSIPHIPIHNFFLIYCSISEIPGQSLQRQILSNTFLRLVFWSTAPHRMRKLTINFCQVPARRQD